MAEIVPQKKDFEKAIEYDKYRNFCKRMITVASIIAAVYGVSPAQNSTVEIIVSVGLMVVSLLSIYFSSRFNETFRRAEKTRRDGFIDNTFDTRLADVSSAGYYDTDNVEHGIKKLMSNLHESCLYTCKIAEKMFARTEKSLLLWFCLILILAVVNLWGTLFVIAVIDVFLSMEVLEDYIELKRLFTETETVQQECKKIAENAASKEWREDNILIGEILQVYLQYEAALSYASIILDADIYNELNPTISQEWNDMRERYYK